MRCTRLRSEDWIFPSYRESAIGLLRGMPASTILSWWRGHPAGWWNPADYNVASICVPIATHVPHAAGLAWGKRLRGENACAIAFFGDGATSEGAFHEGANFAAVMRAPVILFCNNNGWAISTPRLGADARRRRSPTRRSGTGCRARGSTAATCSPSSRRRGRPWPAAAQAKDRPSSRRSRTARRRTRRRTTRASTSIPSASRRRARTSASGATSAISARQGLLDDELEQELKAEAADVLRAGITAAEAEPKPDPGLVFEHALVQPPASFATDLAELRRILGG